jgi:drug/metabolite transporter (DMT)-like permease
VATGSATAPAFVVLGIALVAVSNGAILARLADAPPLAIAAWRVGLATLVVLPLAVAAPREPRFNTQAVACAAGAGALLALHFATWIASLGRRSGSPCCNSQRAAAFRPAGRSPHSRWPSLVPPW